jgi:glycosyltransferase involved in cell wall biosynthesis
VTDPTRPALLIVQPNPCSYSETFLQVHADRLPARVTVVHGGVPTVGDRPVQSQWLPLRAGRRLLRALRGQDWTEGTTAAYLAAIRRYRPAAVLAEYGGTGVGVLDACRRARVPLVVHFHGYDATLREVLRAQAPNYPRLFRGAVAVIAVSRAMRRQLIELGAPPEKVYWNPYGVDCRLFGGADPAAAPPTFVAVGRFAEKKAPHLTLLAFAEVHRACPEARLRMAGEGPLLDWCKDLARGLGVADAVSFLGICPPPVVQRELRGARCFVQHSVTAIDGDSEGTPVSILEAGASGLPVVSTRHAGIPDVVAEGQTGFLVDEYDVPGMAAHLLRLAEEPVLAAELGQAARARVAREFSAERSIARLWAIIESCFRSGSVTIPPEPSAPQEADGRLAAAPA